MKKNNLEPSLYFLHSPTGTGKTRKTLKQLTSQSKAQNYSDVLVVVPNKKCILGWLNELVALKNNGKQLIDSNTAACIAFLEDSGIKPPKVVSSRQLKEIHSLRKFTSIIIDEWHRTPTNILKKLSRYKHIVKKIYFLSATPLNPVLEKIATIEEKDGSDEALIQNIETASLTAVNRIATLLKKNKIKSIADKNESFLELLTKHLDIRAKSIPTDAQWIAPHSESFDFFKPTKFKILFTQSFRDLIIDSNYSKEYAIVNNLVATESKYPFKLTKVKKKNSGSFGASYSPKNLTFGDSKYKTGITLLSMDNGKVKCLLLLINKIWEKDKESKIVIFCTLKGIAHGLAAFLRYELKMSQDEITSKSMDIKKINDEFNSESGKLKILIATEELSESVNLHRKCRYLIHYELPWSPLRLIQRVGRVTRILNDPKKTQMAAVFHIICPGSTEEERINRLIRRLELLKKRGLLPIKIENNNNRDFKRLLIGLIGHGPSLLFESYLAGELSK